MPCAGGTLSKRRRAACFGAAYEEEAFEMPQYLITHESLPQAVAMEAWKAARAGRQPQPRRGKACDATPSSCARRRPKFVKCRTWSSRFMELGSGAHTAYIWGRGGSRSEVRLSQPACT